MSPGSKTATDPFLLEVIMAQNQSVRNDGRVDDPTSGLEAHLGSLNLNDTAIHGTNMSGSPGAAAHQRHSPSQSQSQPRPEPPQTTGRRRLNQAQRRQMNAQFTIIPDVQPQRPFQNYQNQVTPQYQRHAATHSRPQNQIPTQPSSWSRDVSARSRGSWGGPSQGHARNQNIPISPGRYATQGADSMPYQRRPNDAARQQSRPFPHHRHPQLRPEEISWQADYLGGLCHQVVENSEIDRAEIARKEAFRQRIESISRQVIAHYEHEHSMCPTFPESSVGLQCFGSLSSGFATKDSDMDLGLLSPLSKVQPDAPGSPIPRLLEKAFLDAGLGARLLSRTRVPIIKICESPPENLRRDLLKARERWEIGSDSERPDDAEDEQCHDDPPQSEHKEFPEAGSTGAFDSAATADFEVPSPGKDGVQRFRLEQGSKHSLSAYYSLAKRILRRAGGRDFTMSNYKELTSTEWLILNRVCEAFIRGLFDSHLRQRLGRCASLSFDGNSDSCNHRSLAGVFTQAQGERILQLWSEWPEKELFKMNSPQDIKALGYWESLQSMTKTQIDLNPVSYAKELNLALERLRNIPCMSLLLLEQREDEAPSAYFKRTQGISTTLDFDLELLPRVQREIVGRYIAGIHQSEIRDTVASYLRAFPDQVNLQAVGCRHKSLHLARELDKALNGHVFQTDKVPDIERYIELLWSPLAQTSTGDFIVPVPAEASEVVATIRDLEDPRVMTPNQPRDRYRDPLEFPKRGVGAQCDINFSAHLALQNTRLLRCYSFTDPRVRPMVLFVKHWAKTRGINSGYRGTLSSYGYVLMVLHYLVNIAQPFVCPNLQQLAPSRRGSLAETNKEENGEEEATKTCRGYNVEFWRDEQEIIQFAQRNQLNSNTDSVGHLLRGFFEYFAQNGLMSSAPGRRGFDWGREVLSLRSHGGLLLKADKGWTGARTVYAGQQGGDDDEQRQQQQQQQQQQDGKTKDGQVTEIRLRYLFAIEDPFELDHNVARTVTHHGIVSIRDEFRRAWRIICAGGNGGTTEDLLQDVNDGGKSSTFEQLVREIHGLGQV